MLFFSVEILLGFSSPSCTMGCSPGKHQPQDIEDGEKLAPRFSSLAVKLQGKELKFGDHYPNTPSIAASGFYNTRWASWPT